MKICVYTYIRDSRVHSGMWLCFLSLWRLPRIQRAFVFGPRLHKSRRGLHGQPAAVLRRMHQIKCMAYGYVAQPLKGMRTIVLQILKAYVRDFCGE